MREICIIKINIRGVIQKNDDLNCRFTMINMQSFLKIRLFIFYCKVNPSE